jgi:biotin carboxyl carrier protein
MKYVTTIGEKVFLVEVIDEKHIRVNDTVMEVDFESVSGQPVYSMIIDGKSYEAYVYEGEDEWQVLLLGHQFPVKVEDEREKRLKTAAADPLGEGDEFQLKAPMPGLVVAIMVEEDQQVEKGQVLVILESMKMQNELKSPRSGKVERIKVSPRESVLLKQTLLSIV